MLLTWNLVHVLEKLNWKYSYVSDLAVDKFNFTINGTTNVW